MNIPFDGSCPGFDVHKGGGGGTGEARRHVEDDHGTAGGSEGTDDPAGGTGEAASYTKPLLTDVAFERWTKP